MRRFVRATIQKIKPLRFMNSPRGLSIKSPSTIRGAERMTIGDNVFIGPHSLIRAIARTRQVRRNTEHPLEDEIFESRVRIGNRVWATSNLHLDAHSEVVIEDDVMLASNVLISDATHGYGNADVPYMYQARSRVLPVLVKRGSWIGQNVVIMPGVTIGEQSIVGANSVVTKNIPDQCIAVGSPARVIKRWNKEGRHWMRVEAEADVALEKTDTKI